MANNHGRLIEDEMMINLQGKKISELNQNLRYFLSELFGALEANETIHCYQPDDYIKPDLIIEYKGVKKGVSIKTGATDFVHREHVSTFVEFLKGLGVTTKTINTILLFQYGDDTIDGTGKKRMPFDVIKYRYKTRIMEANKELNSNKELIYKVVERTVFDGVGSDKEKAEALYHGDIYDGKVITRYQVYKHIMKKDWDKYEHLHIGPLFIGPHARYVDTEIVNENSRNRINVRWNGLIMDIKYIATKYFSYTPLNKRKY